MPTKEKKDYFAKIPLSLIDVEGQSVRAIQDDDHIVELAMNIAQHGLLHPIVVRTKPDGRYQLDAGFHRLSACFRLKMKEVDCHIRVDPKAPVKAIALIENICKLNMTLEDEIAAVAYLHEEESKSPSQICDLLGKTRQWVDQRLTIPNYPEDIRRELLDGSITIPKADALSNIKDNGTRAFVLNQVISSKLTNKQTEDIVKLYLETPTISGAVNAGLQKKEELQKEKTPTRKCELCDTIRHLQNIRFIAVCADIEDCNKNHLEKFKKLEEEPHAT